RGAAETSRSKQCLERDRHRPVTVQNMERAAHQPALAELLDELLFGERLGGGIGMPLDATIPWCFYGQIHIPITLLDPGRKPLLDLAGEKLLCELLIRHLDPLCHYIHLRMLHVTNPFVRSSSIVLRKPSAPSYYIRGVWAYLRIPLDTADF